MKYTITQTEEVDDGTIYHILQEPGKLGRLFGMKPEVRRYKQLHTRRYVNIDIETVIASDGDKLPYTSRVVSEIEKYQRKF